MLAAKGKERNAIPFNAEAKSPALLMDADNTSAWRAQANFDEILKFGEANVWRTEVDFSGNRLAGRENGMQSLAMLQHYQRGRADRRQPGPRKKNPPDKARKIIAVATSEPDADGWKYLGSVGQRIQGVHPDFDSRSYGCANLGKLVERTGAFDVPKEADGVDVRRKVAAGNDSGAGKGSMT